MNVQPIVMDREEALAKYHACVVETHADGEEFNRACMEAYDVLGLKPGKLTCDGVNDQ